jgi:hypothetical protein
MHSAIFACCPGPLFLNVALSSCFTPSAASLLEFNALARSLTSSFFMKARGMSAIRSFCNIALRLFSLCRAIAFCFCAPECEFTSVFSVLTSAVITSGSSKATEEAPETDLGTVAPVTLLIIV